MFQSHYSTSVKYLRSLKVAKCNLPDSCQKSPSSKIKVNFLPQNYEPEQFEWGMDLDVSLIFIQSSIRQTQC